MGTRKTTETNVRNITQNSTGTYSVSLPIALVQELGWRRGQKLVIRRSGQKILVEDWKPGK